MKRGTIYSPAVQRTCLMIPGTLFSVVVLAALIVNMEAMFARIRAEPVFQVYPTGDMQSRSVSFPVEIQGTTLVAERTAVYDGPYVEDGSHTEVSGITALVLRNQGQQTVARAEITLEQGTRRLVFRAETIPAGAAVLVLEANKSPYKTVEYQTCSGLAVLEDACVLPLSALKIEVQDRNRLAVTNMTDTVLHSVRLFHKGWQDPPGLYIGGVTYATELTALEPGQTVEIYPAYFSDGYSRIVQVTCE